MPIRAIPRIKTRDGTSYVPAEARGAPGGQDTPPQSSFRHDPYGSSPLGRVYVSNSASNTNSPRASTPDLPTEALPPGTLHAELLGLVSFLPYPTTSFVPPPDTIYPENGSGSGEVKRVFLGQLPYFITEMQLSWVMYTFGARHSVTYPERIIKRNPRTGARQVTGCIHGFASAEGLATMARLCHKKLLIDDTGVWFCRNEKEKAVLADYCLAMKNDIKLRPWERPYDSVVVQEATSGAQSQNPSYLNAVQQQRTNASNFSEQQQRHFDSAAYATFHRGSSQYRAPQQNRRRKFSNSAHSDGEDYVAQ